MTIPQQLTYADNACRLLRKTLAQHPDALRAEFPTLSQFNSIGKLIAHCIGAEQRWTLRRLYGEAQPPRYEDQAADALDGLFVDWEAIRERTRAWVAQADEAAWQQTVAIDLPHWNYTATMTKAEVLFHIFNHQTFHLGQISMALQQMDIDPPNFDYVFLRV